MSASTVRFLGSVVASRHPLSPISQFHCHRQFIVAMKNAMGTILLWSPGLPRSVCRWTADALPNRRNWTTVGSLALNSLLLFCTIAADQRTKHPPKPAAN
jgi:hypothetical protein